MIELLSALAGGLILSLAFPSLGFDFLAWLAFIPLFWSLSLVPRPNRAFLCGTLFGLGFFLVDLNWIYGTLVTQGHFAPVVAVVVFLAMIAFLSLFPAGFAYVIALFADQGINPAYVAPFVWVGQEYARSILFTGFPWDLLGYSQASRSMLVQVADVTGVYGISFLILLVNATLWELLRTKVETNRIPWKLIAASVLAFGLILPYGQVRIKQFSSTDNDPSGCAIGILQGNIPQEVKWEGASREETFATYERLGRKAVEQGARLLIWPETSAPVVFGSRDPYWKQPGLISKELGVPMLVGAPSMRSAGGGSNYYNSAFLVDSGMLCFRYDKMHLVPFGEYMPWSWILPLGPGIAAREADYAAGDTMTVMHWRNCPAFSVLICYEAIFPELARLAVNNGAKLLVNITNDGWFGATAAPYQHLSMAGLRSIENRVWLLRSANTGISAAFDPSGRIVKSLPLQREGLFTVTVNEANVPNSFYSRFGDVFAWGCVGTLVLLGISVIGLRGRRKSWIQN
jgi:apolipoprotein N-acyltransferase